MEYGGGYMRRGLGAGFLFAGLIVLGLATPAGAATNTTKARQAASSSRKTVPGIGTTLKVLNQHKQYESVKLIAVTDPAQPGDSFTTPDSGKRFVGVQLQITNQSKGTDSDDANNNTSIIGSNEQVYSADVSTLAGCTNFNNGTYTLTQGATEVGCVSFQLPMGVAVAEVAYNPDSGFSTNNGFWKVGAEVPPTVATTPPSHSQSNKKGSPGIGSSLRVLNQDKQYESVKLLAVMDPAQPGDSFTTPDAGKRFVGVELQITNQSNGTDSDDANNNTSIVGSNRQAYSADVNSIAGCTNFDNGTYTLTQGVTEIGCVTFQVPTGVTVVKVAYNPNSGFSTNNAFWTLHPPG
jgi:hypothetical protein